MKCGIHKCSMDLLDFPTAWFLSELSLELLERHMTVCWLEICPTSYSMKLSTRRWRLEKKTDKSDFIYFAWKLFLLHLVLHSNTYLLKPMKFHLELSAPFQGPCSPKRPPPPSLKTTALPTHLVWVVGQMRKILSLSTTQTNPSGKWAEISWRRERGQTCNFDSDVPRQPPVPPSCPNSLPLLEHWDNFFPTSLF